MAARRLRRETTPAESALWAALRDRRLGGLKFRRQHAVETMVLDFFCPELRLVVEIDGGIHDEPEQVERDAERTERLAAHGYRVLRLRNEDVIADESIALDRILAFTKEP
jgi:very-short-patch-repair endonuclease